MTTEAVVSAQSLEQPRGYLDLRRAFELMEDAVGSVVELPLENVPRNGRSALSQLPLAGRRILFVDDDYLLVSDMVEHFRAEGAEIAGPFGQLQQALRAARTETLDGAVLDIDLRGECSLRLAEVLLERNVPFVFVTGYDVRLIPERFAQVPRYQKPVEAALIARKFMTGAPSPGALSTREQLGP